MDLCFASDSNHKLIQQLYPVHQFQVNVETFNSKNLQFFNFSLEKLENMIQLRICDVHNQNRMYLCTIDNMTYQEIRTEQSLQVNFQGFVDHLMTILDSCRKNELHVSLTQAHNCFALQFYEKRSLKNLVHLFLRVQEAPPPIIMYHLSLSLNILKDEVSSATAQNKILQNEVNKRDFHVQQLQTEVDGLKEKLAENENMILHRNTEETPSRLESKKYETLKHELDDMKKKLNAMSADNNRLKNNLNQFDGKDKQQRMRMDEMSQQMAEYLESLRAANKEKSNLQAEIEAEKQICHTKKRALQIATDELAKNHETIKQQERTVVKLEKGIEWRSLVLMRMNDDHQRNPPTIEKREGIKLN